MRKVKIATCYPSKPLFGRFHQFGVVNGETVAFIEWDDGTIDTCNPKQIQFLNDVETKVSVEWVSEDKSFKKRFEDLKMEVVFERMKPSPLPVDDWKKEYNELQDTMKRIDEIYTKFILELLDNERDKNS